MVEFFAFLALRELSLPGFGDEEGVDDDAVGAGKDLGVENVQTGGSQGTGNFVEQPAAVPSADGDGGVAAVGFVLPGNDRFEFTVFLVELQHQEAVDHGQVVNDVTG